MRKNSRTCAIELSLRASGLAFALASGAASRNSLVTLKTDTAANCSVWANALQEAICVSFFGYVSYASYEPALVARFC